ncbi:MAG: hypothetical protein WEB53_01305 [Akkermansiaceae bacterium]
MIAPGKLLLGSGCLALGLAGGYFLSQNGKSASSPPILTAPLIKSARPASERTQAKRDGETRKFRQSIPPSDQYVERTQWLENLAVDKIAALIEALCTDIGPDGLQYQDKSFLEKALKKWWQEDREGTLKWASQLPSGGFKRYIMKFSLGELLKDDAPQALAMSEAYQAEDPEWSHVAFQDTHVWNSITEALKKPATTAEEMLAQFSKLSRGTGTTGSDVGSYPENFDFRKLLEEIDAGNLKDEKRPSFMPSDVLHGWAKADPKAATEWFLLMADNQRDVAFQDWADIAKAVSISSGPRGYHEWAAGIIAEATPKQRSAIFENTNDQDAMGIAASISDVGLRDTVLAAAAQRNSGTSGQTEQTINFLSQISTPEARLQAITNDQGQYAWWIKTYTIPASGWQKLGLTREQFDDALDKVQR